MQAFVPLFLLFAGLALVLLDLLDVVEEVAVDLFEGVGGEEQEVVGPVAGLVVYLLLLGVVLPHAFVAVSYLVFDRVTLLLAGQELAHALEGVGLGSCLKKK